MGRSPGSEQALHSGATARESHPLPYSPRLTGGTQTSFEKNNSNVAATLARQTKGVKGMTDLRSQISDPDLNSEA